MIKAGDKVVCIKAVWSMNNKKYLLNEGLIYDVTDLGSCLQFCNNGKYTMIPLVRHSEKVASIEDIKDCFITFAEWQALERDKKIDSILND